METSEGKLKHLGFVRVFTVNAVVLISNLYEYAKQNSGPLKSTVGTVENAVTTVVRPVYEKIKDVPDDVLVFLDKKVFVFIYLFIYYCVCRIYFLILPSQFVGFTELSFSSSPFDDSLLF